VWDELDLLAGETVSKSRIVGASSHLSTNEKECPGFLGAGEILPFTFETEMATKSLALLVSVERFSSTDNPRWDVSPAILRTCRKIYGQ
jgi:hypothetical protein